MLSLWLNSYWVQCLIIPRLWVCVGIAMDLIPHVQSTTCDKAFTNQQRCQFVCYSQGREPGKEEDESQTSQEIPFFSTDI